MLDGTAELLVDEPVKAEKPDGRKVDPNFSTADHQQVVLGNEKATSSESDHPIKDEL